MQEQKINPYSAALGGRDPREIISQTVARLNQLIAPLSPDALEQSPAPGRWSARELVCHLADAEIAWAWRLRKGVEEPHHVIQPWDQTPWAKAYGRYSLPQALAAFEGLRNWNCAFIAGLSDADQRKPLTHPERGEWTLWTIVEFMAGHDEHHLNKLAERLAAKRSI